MARTQTRRGALLLAAAAAAGWACLPRSSPYPDAAWCAEGVRPVQITGGGRWVWCTVRGREGAYRRLQMIDGSAAGEASVRLASGPDAGSWSGHYLPRWIVDLADGRTVFVEVPFAMTSRVEVWRPGRAETAALAVPPPDADAMRAAGAEEFSPGAGEDSAGFAAFFVEAAAAPRGGVRLSLAVAGAGEGGRPAWVSRTLTLEGEGGEVRSDRYDAAPRLAGRYAAALNRRAGKTALRPSRIGGPESRLRQFGLKRPQAWLTGDGMRWGSFPWIDGDSAAAVWTRRRPSANFGLWRVPRCDESGVALFERDAAGRPRVVGQSRGGGGLDVGRLWGRRPGPFPLGAVLSPGGRSVVVWTSDGRAYAFRFGGGGGP